MRYAAVAVCLAVVTLAVVTGAAANIVGWHVVSQTETTITYGWTPEPESNSDGYRFYVNGARVSNSADPLLSSVTFQKVPDAKYGITELFRGPLFEDQPTPPTPPPTPPPPPPPSGEPGPIAGQGYGEVFRDDFDGTALDSTSWNPKEFWESEPRPGAIVVSNGSVKINNTRPYLDDQSISTGPYWGGEPGKRSWQFGYFEARMKFTDAVGSWPAFWMISRAHASFPNWPDCPEPDLNFELDVMEYQGDEPGRFYGTEHRNTGDVCGTPNQTRSVITNPGGRLANEWHTYSVKWTPANLTWYVDGVQQGQPQALWDSGDQEMYLSLTMQACGWDGSNGCSSATPDTLTTEVDYVTVWQQAVPTPPPAPPPPPPPPHTGDQVIRVNQNWTCNGPVDLALVRVTGAFAGDAVNFRSGCTGHIQRLEVSGSFNDCIKVNPPAPAPHDITIESGYCRSSSGSGGHFDGIQMGGGRDITIRNFVMDWCCTGGGNVFVQSFNGGTPINFLCDHCAFGPRHANQIRTPFDASSGVRNSRVCKPSSGRAVYIPLTGDKGGNVSPEANSPLCTFDSLLAYATG